MLNKIKINAGALFKKSEHPIFEGVDKQQLKTLHELALQFSDYALREYPHDRIPFFLAKSHWDINEFLNAVKQGSADEISQTLNPKQASGWPRALSILMLDSLCNKIEPDQFHHEITQKIIKDLYFLKNTHCYVSSSEIQINIRQSYLEWLQAVFHARGDLLDFDFVDNYFPYVSGTIKGKHFEGLLELYQMF